MAQLVPLLSVIIAFGALILIAVGFREARKPDQIEERLKEFAKAPRSLEEIELAEPFSERVIRPILSKLARIGASRTPQHAVETLRLKLSRAGNPYNLGPHEFLGLRSLAAVVLCVIGVFLLLLSHQSLLRLLAGSAVMGAIGYFMPVLWLRQLTRRRQKSILKSLPDAIDLLTISVEAGLGFDAALNRVAEKWDRPLSLEFRRVLSEMRMGKPRREVLREMAHRADVPDLSTFVSSIIQAEQLGVSISRVLRVQSDQMRVRRRQLAEAEAHRAPIKIIFPMVFLMFPSIYVIILGPAIPKIAALMGIKFGQ